VGCNNLGESAQVTPVITVNDRGFQSINDFFDRQISTADGTRMYHWVSGNATITSGAAYTVSILSASTTNIIKIPLSSNNQMATVNYTLGNANMNRTGQLNINISTDGYASVSDSYNFVENIANASNLLDFSVNTANAASLKYIILTCTSAASSASTLEYNINFLN